MTPDELITIIRASAGDPDSGRLDYADMDLGFDELGYDSIQLLEVAAHIKRELDIPMSDTSLAETRTMRELLGLIDAATADRPKR